MKNYSSVILLGIFLLMMIIGFTSLTQVYTDGLDPVTTLIDKTQASGNLPSIINAAGTNRGAGFNDEYVFVASRQDGNHIYYWSIADPDASPQELNLNEVSGGIFTLADLTVVGQHVFASNMVFAGGEFKVYHWAGINSEPVVLLQYTGDVRLGDAFTVLGNPEEEALLIASGHGSSNFYVWDIQNSQIPDNNPAVYTYNDILNANFARITKVPGEDLFLASGSGFGLLLLDNQMNQLFYLQSGFFPYWSMYPHIFYYNGNRFLAYHHVKDAPPQNLMYVLDISDGATVLEALQSLAQSSFAERLIHSVDLGNTSNGNASVSLDILDDAAGNIYALGYSAGNGFIVQKYGNETGAGINQTNLVQSVIYPIPAKNTILITSDQKMKQVVINDMAGRESLSIRVGTHQLNLNAEDFSNGLYFVRIYTESGVSFQKLLIQK